MAFVERLRNSIANVRNERPTQGDSTDDRKNEERTASKVSTTCRSDSGSAIACESLGASSSSGNSCTNIQALDMWPEVVEQPRAATQSSITMTMMNLPSIHELFPDGIDEDWLDSDSDDGSIDDDWSGTVSENVSDDASASVMSMDFQVIQPTHLAELPNLAQWWSELSCSTQASLSFRSEG